MGGWARAAALALATVSCLGHGARATTTHDEPWVGVQAVSYSTVSLNAFCKSSHEELLYISAAACKSKCDARSECIGYSGYKWQNNPICIIHKYKPNANNLDAYPDQSYECYAKTLCTGSTYRASSGGSCATCPSGTDPYTLGPGYRNGVEYYSNYGDAEATSCACDANANKEDDGNGGCQCKSGYEDDGNGGCELQTPDPTTSPTPKPTDAPSTTPSAAPTISPTPKPTDAPSTTPSAAPTTSPTPKPTDAPSTTPSRSPTNAPTTTPSVSPSASPTHSPTTSPVPPTLSPTLSPSITPTASPTPFGFCEDARIAIAFDVSASDDALSAQRSVAKALIEESLYLDTDWGARAGIVVVGGALGGAQTLLPGAGLRKIDSVDNTGSPKALSNALMGHLKGLGALQGWTDLGDLLGDHADELDGLDHQNPVIVLFTEGYVDTNKAPKNALQDLCDARDALRSRAPKVTVACYQSGDDVEPTALSQCVCDTVWTRGAKEKSDSSLAIAHQIRNVICEPHVKQVDPCDGVNQLKNVGDEEERENVCLRIKRNYRGLKTGKNEDLALLPMRTQCQWDAEQGKCAVLPRFAGLYLPPREGECWGLNRRKCKQEGDKCSFDFYEGSAIEICFPLDGGDGGDDNKNKVVCDTLSKKKCKKNKDVCSWEKKVKGKKKSKNVCKAKATGDEDPCENLDRSDCRAKPQCRFERPQGGGRRQCRLKP